MQNKALSFNVPNITSTPGQTVPMNISITGAAKTLSGLVLIQGIPSQIRLSSGILSGNAWLVSLSELGNLQLIVPYDFQGRFDLEVILVLGEGKQRQTRSASVAIQPENPPRKRLFILEENSQTRSALSRIPPEPQPKDRVPPVKSREASPQAKLNPSPPAISSDLPRETNPADRPNSDNALTAREVSEFCDGQRYLCRKICYLRFRDDRIGCPQACESRVARCIKTGCYQWAEADFVIAEKFGGYRCPR